MPGDFLTRPAGVPAAPSLRLRLLAALLVIVHLAAPVTAVMADPAPPIAGHATHVGTPDSTGCQPFHDELFCLSCRVLFTPLIRPIHTELTALPGTLLVVGTTASTERPVDPAVTPLHARAPPCL